MYSEIDKRTAARLSLCGEPAALAGDTAASLPAAARGVYFTHFAVVYVLFHECADLHITVVSHDHKYLAVLFGGSLHLFGFGDAYGVRLFTENMKSVIECLNGNGRMKVVWRADIDCVKSRHVYKVKVVFKNLVYAVFYCKSLCFFRLYIADGDYLGIVHTGIAGHVAARGDISGAYKSDFKLLVHKYPFL